MAGASRTFDILIVGGGISGVSLAARLAPHARVGLVEAEPHLGSHATGRSAALLVETYGPSGIRRLTTLSRPFFETPPDGFSDAPLARPRGALIYGGTENIAKLRSEFEVAAASAPVDWLEGSAIVERCPLLRPGHAVAAFIEEGALDLEANTLLQTFARSARGNEAELIVGAPVQRIAREGSGWIVEAGGHRIACGILVNAAGAWADELGAKAGAQRIWLQPMRRTAATLAVAGELADVLARSPFAAPVDGSFYFKPEAAQIMVSLSDETPSDPCDAYPEEMDVAVALDRFHSATIVPPARPTATWAGLRTFAPDRLPVVGHDADVEGFFWYAGQGGWGIQTAPALSDIAAKVLLGNALRQEEEAIMAPYKPERCRRSVRRNARTPRAAVKFESGLARPT